MRAAACAAAIAVLLAAVGEGHEAAGCEHWDAIGLLQAHALVHRGQASGAVARAALPEDPTKQQAGAEQSRRSEEVLVEENYEEKVLRLKEVVALYRKARADVKLAQADAEQARSRMHSEADRLAMQEARRQRPAAGVKGESINGTFPKGVAAGPLVALHAAVADVHLAHSVGGTVTEAREWAAKFLNSTKEAADDFARAAAALPDAELPLLTARFLDEAMHRLKASQQHALLVAESAKQAMPGPVGETLTQVIGLLAQEVPRPSAAGPAAALFGRTCSEVSQLMGSVASYSLRLKRLSEAMHGSTAEEMAGLGGLVPNLSSSSNSTSNVTLAQELVGMASLEADGLQEAARYVVKTAGPVITDRIGCTFSGVGRSRRFGLIVALVHVVVVFWAAS